ncbi:hypothetical protein H0H87_000306 [Tephrocybe sp. NHM501043]|nr:hypothetical protein H0H87_000306 [Tephrocybe sp. NHM501043]
MADISAPISHKYRDAPYGVKEYSNEFASLVQAIQDNPKVPIKNMLIGPSLTSGPWLPDQLWPTGYLDRFKDVLKIIAMEHARAQALGKPFMLFETNTATCSGLQGISDTFGAAMWAVDYGLTMAAANFSGALLHTGGVHAYYNVRLFRHSFGISISLPIDLPFFLLEAPPAPQTDKKWTIGAIYYSVLVVAEVFGKSNVSQIIDTSNNGIYNPSYAIYDEGALSKLVFINFIDDPTGAHDITGTITINGGQIPSEVYVKYLLASSVSVKTNITWAGQTFGNKFEVDGLPKGDVNVVKIACNQGVNQCHIPLKAPSLAVVFLKAPPMTNAAPGRQTLMPSVLLPVVLCFVFIGMAY